MHESTNISLVLKQFSFGWMLLYRMGVCSMSRVRSASKLWTKRTTGHPPPHCSPALPATAKSGFLKRGCKKDKLKIHVKVFFPPPPEASIQKRIVSGFNCCLILINLSFPLKRALIRMPFCSPSYVKPLLICLFSTWTKREPF